MDRKMHIHSLSSDDHQNIYNVYMLTKINHTNPHHCLTHDLSCIQSSRIVVGKLESHQRKLPILYLGSQFTPLKVQYTQGSVTPKRPAIPQPSLSPLLQFRAVFSTCTKAIILFLQI